MKDLPAGLVAVATMRTNDRHSLLCKGEVQMWLDQDSDEGFAGHVESAKVILDDLSMEYNPIGLGMITLALCHLLHTGYYGKENANFPGAKKGDVHA